MPPASAIVGLLVAGLAGFFLLEVPRRRRRLQAHVDEQPPPPVEPVTELRTRPPRELPKGALLSQFDPECIGGPRDYVELTRSLLRLVGDELAAAHEISCRDRSGKRYLTLRRDSQRFTVRLDSELGDWADVTGIVTCLNQVAAAAKVEGRFFEVSEAHWGQGCGVLFARSAQALEIFRSGMNVYGVIDLGEDTVLSGMTFAKGTSLEVMARCIVAGTFASTEPIAGIPCRTARWTWSVWQGEELGDLKGCTLGAPFSYGGITLPLATELSSLERDGSSFDIEIARLKEELALADLTLPPGTTLEFHAAKLQRCWLGEAIVWRGKRYRKESELDLSQLST